MIIDALVDFYDKMAKTDHPLPLHGYNMESVNAIVHLNLDGTLAKFVMLGKEEPVKKNGKVTKTITVFPKHLAPSHSVGRSNNIRPYPYLDTSEYMLGIHAPDKNETSYAYEKNVLVARDKFKEMKNMMLNRLVFQKSDLVTAVLNFFENWDPVSAMELPCFTSIMDQLSTMTGITFAYNGECILDSKIFCNAYNDWIASHGFDSDPSAKPVFGRDMITGEPGIICRTHMKVKLGCAPKKAALCVSNNMATQFLSYEQGYGFPCTEQTTHKYTSALQYLANSDAHHVYDKTTNSDYLIWSDDPEDDKSMELLPCLFDIDSFASRSADAGRRTLLNNILLHRLSEEDMDKEYHVAVISSRNGYVLWVKDYRYGTLREFCKGVLRHYKNMEIYRDTESLLEDGSKIDFASPERIANSVWATDDMGAPIERDPTLKRKLTAAIFNDAPYPKNIFQLMLQRIKINSRVKDSKLTPTQVGFLKAYMIRNLERSDIAVALNETRSDVPYVLGRIFAIAERTQQRIDPDNQSTYKNLFFSQMMDTPAAAFSKLYKKFVLLGRRAKTSHEGWKIKAYKDADSAIDILQGMMEGDIPERFNSVDSAAFVLGYAQQRDKIWSEIREKAAAKDTAGNQKEDADNIDDAEYGEEE